jgi:hypothetical protein
LNPAVYWMDVCKAIIILERKRKNVATWGTPKIIPFKGRKEALLVFGQVFQLKQIKNI